MGDFYHVWIRPRKGISAEQVVERMNLAIDWIRYASNVWILYTTADEDKWQVRLKPLVEPDGELFICHLDIQQRSGWMSQKFWEWIQQTIKKYQR